MRILIIGSEGFIGSHLINRFNNPSNNLVGCDLFEAPKNNYTYIKVSRLSPQWDEVFSNQRFDVCINASGSGNVPYSMQHPLIDFEANALDVIRILEAIRKYNAECKYFHISSAAVYGNPATLPVKEEAAKLPLSPYGWHKLMSEMVCSEYRTIYNIRVAIIRPFSVYGEGLRKQLLWDICKRLSANGSIELFGTGQETRDFIHCDDLTSLIELLINKAAFEGEVYNTASGEETSIATIAHLFEDYFGGKKKISFSGETRAGDPLHWRADVSVISALGFSTSIRLEDGIQNYIHWFEKTARK
jgi:UDP-glucose 4-epimerase